MTAPLPPPSSLVPTVSPASLSSLAIYNPSLGPTDESVQDQIVFYTSRSGQSATANEKLRQIGLAQGLVEFARGFSKTDNCTSVETNKSRVVVLEIEEGWWLLAQVGLTYIHNPTTQPPTSEFSSREVAPPHLLSCQIRRAYRQFRFNYGTLASNYSRLGRSAFCRRLDKYWLRWAWGRWEVMLSGSPAVDILTERSVKMAGGWPGKEIGDQQREFLEGWVKKENARGLVDMVVSRFGDPAPDVAEGKDSEEKSRPSSGLWFWPSGGRGSDAVEKPKKANEGVHSAAVDGCVFQGTGALERGSVRDVTTYLHDLFNHGEEPFTIHGGGARRKKRRKRPGHLSRVVSQSHPSVVSAESSPRKSSSTIRPAPLEVGRRSSSISSVVPADSNAKQAEEPPPPQEIVAEAEQVDMAAGAPAAVEEGVDGNANNKNVKLMNILTFGWSGRTTSTSATPQPPQQEEPPKQNGESTESNIKDAREQVSDTKKNYGFIIGFLGDLDAEDLDDDDDEQPGKITSRSVWIERKVSELVELSSADDDEGPEEGEGVKRRESGHTIRQANLEELEIVVYTNHPFVFAFLIDPQAAHLSSPAFYRSLHHQLSPLIDPLLASPPPPAPTVSPVKAALPSTTQQPYDLILNMAASTLYSTLPPIPEPGVEDIQGWSRVDALHVYTIIIGILQETANEPGARERSVRSTRGWWINWMRLDQAEGIVARRAGERKGEAETAGSGEFRKYFEGLVKGSEGPA